MIDSFDLVGYLGAVLCVYTFIRTQLRREYVKQLSYSAINFVGSGLLIVSLCFHINLPALIINAVWICFSGYGIYRCMKYRRKQTKA